MSHPAWIKIICISKTRPGLIGSSNVLFYLPRSVVLGMGDGSMMTLTIADPEKKGISEYLKTLPSRNPVGCPAGPIPGIGSGYMQVGS